MCHVSICFQMPGENAIHTHYWRAQTRYYIHMTNPPIQTLAPANHLVRTWSSYAICPLGLTLIYQINTPITLIMQDNRTAHKAQWDPSVHRCFWCQTVVIETEIMAHNEIHLKTYHQTYWPLYCVEENWCFVLCTVHVRQSHLFTLTRWIRAIRSWPLGDQ